MSMTRKSIFTVILMLRNIIYAFAVLIFMSTSACSKQSAQETYKQEANALCDAFNPATWGGGFINMNPSEKAEMLAKKIQAAIHSDKMKKIFQTLSHDRSESAYTNFTKSVSGLIGEHYKCDAMKDYFSVSFN